MASYLNVRNFESENKTRTFKINNHYKYLISVLHLRETMNNLRSLARCTEIEM
jgi:hypothetical protein